MSTACHQLCQTSTKTVAFSIIEPEPSNATEAFLSVLMGKATGAHVRGLVSEGYCIVGRPFSRVAAAQATERRGAGL